MKRLLILFGILLLVGTASAAITQYNLTDGSYTINIFNSTGTLNFTVPAGVSSIQYLVLAGGGAGGSKTVGNDGGGGAGGLLEGNITVTPASQIQIVVGVGGAPIDSFRGNNGVNSTLSNITTTLTAVGGGAGGAYNATGGSPYNDGADGGSGGGAAQVSDATTGGSNVTGQGNVGGGHASGIAGCGGGGAGNAGNCGTGAVGGMGGNGTQSNITGTLTYYAGGGSGASHSSDTASIQGGLGGGGRGNFGATAATNGTDGLGGGGGGGGEGTEGKYGGSGVVIIRYTTPVVTNDPILSFTANSTGGVQPLSVQFNDTSITTPTAWNWSYTNVTPGNNTPVYWSTIQNATQTFGNGHWHINLNVTNASGFNNTALNYPITVSDSGGLSGWNRQDIMMDQIYTFTLNVKDSVSLSGIPGATVATSNGDNTTTSVLGVATISTNYTALVVQVGASGYLSRTISYVVDRDRTETIYLTPIVVVPTAVPNTNIIYTPKQIELTVVSYDPAGVVVKNASVTLAAVANTLQADSQLETLYGINPIAANQLMNGTLVMHGLTDSGGGIVFTVLQSINYAATIVDPRDGKTYTAMLYPGLDPYTIWIGTSPLAINTTAHTYLNTTKIFITQPDVANVTMNMQYQNKLGTTTSVVFTVKYQNNLTTAYQTTIAGFGTSMVYANYTVPNVRGQGYFYGYNASRNV